MILLEPGKTAWDLKFSLLRIPVRVHPFFWLMALLFTYWEQVPFEIVLIGIGCMFFSILVHEFGHAFCGRYYGDKENHVVLYHFGGLCIDGRGVPRHWPRIALLLWGPGAGFILGAAAFGLSWAIAKGHIALHGVYLHSTLHYLIFINVIWGVVNLLPVFPLDGGQIMRELVNWKAPRRGDPFAFTISFYAAIVVAAAFVGLHVSGISFGLYPILLFAALAYQSWQIRRQLGQFGSLGDFEPPREPWEQDADWWKK